jgi:class 3 adenylate cyclase
VLGSGIGIGGGSPLPLPEMREALQPHVTERRIASVLFGDLVGFTTISEGRDPEEVRELLSRYFDASRTVIQRYGGTIEKFIGDAVMAVWGVPTTHEDDAERAVRAGLDLVDRVAGLAEEVGVPDLCMRVGVVTGEVAVTVGATGEGMVAGDIVNTAARVQAAASPGAVWVDDVTLNLTAAAVAYTDAGEHVLKGKSNPLRLHHARAVVASVGGAQRVDGLEAPFTGRDRELRFVKELFEATVEDHRARLVLVSGVAGTGKSRLGWEFEKYIDGLSVVVRWHRGRCLSYGEGVAFWALAEMVRGRLGLSEGDDEARLVEGLDEGLAAFVPDEEERRWLRPLLLMLLGIESGAFSREDMFSAWTLFFERVAQGGEAVVLLVEDLQYADDGLVDFLEHALQTARFPLFILALARPEFGDRRSNFGSGRGSTTIQLDPLSDPAMETLVDGLVDGLPDSARSALIARAEGIPLYAVETVRALIDQDAVVPQQGRYVLAPDAWERVDLDSLGAPASLQALVSSRLDALDPAERALIQDAAVLGMSFSLVALSALGTRSDVELQDMLAPLVRKEIVELQTDPRSPERGQYRFVQAVVRQVAYETLSRRDRKTRHLAVARHLSTESELGEDVAAVIAQHYLDALASSATDDTDGALLADTAQNLLERAARRSLALGSPAEAYRHYSAALGLPTTEDTRARLDEGAARATLALGDQAAVIRHTSRAIAAHDAAGRVLEAARVAAVAGASMVLHQDHRGAIAELSPRYDACAARSDADPLILDLTETLGQAHNYVGEAEQARFYFARMLSVAEAAGDKERIVNAMTFWSNLWIVGGNPTTGLAVLGRAVELARELQRPSALLRPLINTCAFVGTHDLNVALDAAAEAYRLAEQIGNTPLGSLAGSNLLVHLWSSGRWPELRELLAERPAEGIDRPALATRAAVTRWLQLATGEPLDPLPAGVEELEDSPDLQGRAWAQNARVAGMVDPSERSDRAALALEATRAGMDWGGLEDDFVHHWSLAAEASIALGDAARIREVLDLVEGRPPGLRPPYVEAQFLRLRGMAALDNDPVAAEADLRAAVAALTAFGAPFVRAQAEFTLSGILAGTDHEREAGEFMERARETFTSLGAKPWLARADAAQLLVVDG